MRWLLFFAVLVPSALAFVLGLWLARRGKRSAYAVVSVGLAAVLLRALVRYVPEVEYAVLPFDLYAVIHPWWALPFAFAILGAGTHEMSTPGARRGVGVFAGVLFLVAIQRLWFTARFEPASVHGLVRRDGVCMQSTDYTCGAASAAMLLHQLGVKTTEREMAELCWTNGLTGTDEFGVCRGLRAKLVGLPYRPAIVRSDWDDLRRRGGPAMATVHHAFMIDHWVLVLEVKDDEVVLLDPLAARRVEKKEKFLELWRKVLVVAEKT